ncbi:phosphatidylinositol 3-kinase regulatory subunit [Anaeramoeba ignava]|uniref:Phosphatidylinositol 3-kinase regulatory subunit n=1 Tax=Anaeramoeba ignava TaxID=1746090 RepID=A0A9Q0LF10_ANAIG|nr:phosphatidylinositol 3-kinase regulatory subunit [Anaeramoeba ignava]
MKDEYWTEEVPIQGSISNFTAKPHMFPKLPFTQEFEKELTNIEAQYKDIPNFNPTLKICIAGNDGTIQQILITYAFPIGEDCRVSRYLSVYDGIYHRNVNLRSQIPFKLIPSLTEEPNIGAQTSNILTMNIQEKGVLPGLSLPEKGKTTKSTFENPTQGDLLFETIEGYFRNAHQYLEITIYTCECWKKPPRPNVETAPDITIPFIQNVHVLAPKDTRNRITYLDLSLKWIDINPDGIPYKVSPTSQGTYYSVIVKNIPSSAESGYVACPFNRSLECYLVTSEQDKRISKAKKHDRDINVIVPLHISQLEIESQKPFSISVDHTSLGPFSKIRISPLKDLNNNPLSFTVAVFVPFAI